VVVRKVPPRPVSKQPASAAQRSVVVKPNPAPAKTGKPLEKAAPVEVFDEEVIFQTPAPPKREFRAAWIATVDNIDWPSKKGMMADIQQRELLEYFDQQQQMGFNAVVVQIRSAADAFYAKSSEPWSEWLTGQQGLAPEPFYDPLEFMIEEAHQRGLEFHAWFNLDRAVASPRASVASTNIIHQKPEWMLTYGGKKLFNLGVPAVRSYIAGIVANVVREYDIDGIHFDDYFYPYAIAGQVLKDDSTYQANYNGMKKDDWRRDNVTKLVIELRDSIRAYKPWVKFGISPFGIWKNQRNDPDGSATNGGQSYYELYADTRKWAREGLIDYIVPQVYFSSEFNRVPYKTLVDWWTKNTGKAQLYIGHAAYRVGKGSERDPGWWRESQFPDQVRYNRQQQRVQGSVFFSARDLKKNPMAIRDSLRTNFYRYTALVPTMPWLDSIPPLPPRNLKAADTAEGVELTWHQSAEAMDGDGANAYLVYRFDGRQARVKLDDPRFIIARCNGEEATHFIDKTAEPGKRYTYVVTALDRLNNESREVLVRIR
jgi:uncharacterized lipoprotein YddW (UPF0748 family)